MTTLNKKEVSRLFNLYSKMNERVAVHQENITHVALIRQSVAKNEYHRTARRHWFHAKQRIDMQLAEMGIFINGKDSQNILYNWDESYYNERYNKLYAEYDKAKRVYFKESKSKAAA